MKRSELLFTALLVPLDALMLLLSAIITYDIRFRTTIEKLFPEGYQITFYEFLIATGIIIPLFLIIFAFAGLYNTHLRRNSFDEFGKIFLAISSGFMGIIVFIFLQKELFLSSRFLVLGSWATALLFITIGRALARGVQEFLYRYGIGVHRTVIIGETSASYDIVKEATHPRQGRYKIISQLVSSLAVDEYKNKLDELIKRPGVDDLIQCDPEMPSQITLQLIKYAHEHKIDVTIAPNLYQTHTSNIAVTNIAGNPLIEIKPTPLDGWGKITKRLMDIVGSLILIILLSPVYIITALIVKLTSPGPVFFSKLENGDLVQRVGQGGKPFPYFKFRSMRHNVHQQRYTTLAQQNLRKDTPLVKIENDPRITPFGRFIRRFSIDELPELFIVLRGDMSLVGPRPHFPEEVSKYRPDQRDVLRIKPGITGMAQVLGRSDLSFDEEVRLDVHYIEHWSLALDIKILLQTIPAVLKKRSAL